MAKRRTRKDKKNAKHNIKVTWVPSESSGSSSKSVKNQSKKGTRKEIKSEQNKKNAVYTAHDVNTASIKKDIVKSISLAGLILGLELVIYFVL